MQMEFVCVLVLLFSSFFLQVYLRKKKKLNVLEDLLLKPRKSFKLPPELKEMHRKTSEGKMKKDDWLEKIMDVFETPPHLRTEAKKLMLQAEATITLFPSVSETLHTLKDRGIRIGVVTDSITSTQEKKGWLKKAGLEIEWDAWANSCEVGAKKPSPEIFNAALKKIELEPWEVYFVGHKQSEIDGAKEVGLETVSLYPDNPEITADHSIHKFEELLQLPKLVPPNEVPKSKGG